MPDFVLATRNLHKLREFERLLTPAAITVRPLPADVELPPETGDTFAANALTKARTAAAATGRAAIADDSGIESAALGGAPGVRSARYAGEHATDEENLRKLIAEAPPGSGLRYVCVLAYVDPDRGEEQLFEGVSEGRMSAERRGERGFGYDPVFVPNGDHGDRTMAELTDDEKDEISHRGRAARAFAQWVGA
ncbi:MAG TPA: RdgB/HAM1 family non-canonical purine NTP pyrophosphatase [Solirubrobacteraceae bacterium]|jgi:XTP/dITP diphosphohydrolase|nr:RdgB/HAM1 family non-canonical purine NTP pyrophosphatase [Solirubrobacteraceae bacterium]